MNEAAKPERRRFQFRLRRLLLWTAVVALGLGVLSPLELDVSGWIFLSGWFFAISLVRWTFGRKWAASVAVVMGVSAYAWHSCSLVARNVNGVVPVDYYFDAAIAVALPGSLVGFVSFLVVEFAWQAVNRLDRIGQSDG